MSQCDLAVRSPGPQGAENRRAWGREARESLLPGDPTCNAGVKHSPRHGLGSGTPHPLLRGPRPHPQRPPAILKKVDALISREKSLKKKIKEDAEALHTQTKHVIENLSDGQILDLLRRKWITPLVEDLNDLPLSVVRKLIARLEALCTKYEMTFAGVDSEIDETETALNGLIDELTGNAFVM